MLYSLFITHWNNPNKAEWSEQVKKDLEDFGIKRSLEYIKTKSGEAFKSVVKEKAKVYALQPLVKNTEKALKSEKLEYSTLAMQNYLKVKT